MASSDSLHAVFISDYNALLSTPVLLPLTCAAANTAIRRSRGSISVQVGNWKT